MSLKIIKSRLQLHLPGANEVKALQYFMNIAYRIAVIKVEPASYFELTKDSPYLTCRVNYGVAHHEFSGENRLWTIGCFQSFKKITQEQFISAMNYQN